jgi:hypothetical protein
MQKYGKRPGLMWIDTGSRNKVSPTYCKAAFVTYVYKGGGVAKGLRSEAFCFV